MDDKLERELREIAKWACCSEPERRARAEHSLADANRRIAELEARIEVLTALTGKPIAPAGQTTADPSDPRINRQPQWENWGRAENEDVKKRPTFWIDLDPLAGQRIVAEIANMLDAEANRYAKPDGSPGDLADSWGWRTIAETLREVAKKVRLQLKPIDQTTKQIGTPGSGVLTKTPAGEVDRIHIQTSPAEMSGNKKPEG